MTTEASPVRDLWRARRFELLGALAFWIFMAWPLLQPGRLETSFDTFTYSAPNETVTFDALRSGHLPQWNPTIFGGVAHLANPQVGLFDPLKWPFVPLDPWRAVVLITALHLLVLTIGMVVLAHRLRLRAPAGLIAAIAVLGSGMAAGKVLQYPQVTVVAWIPWLLAAIDMVLDRPARPRRAIGWLALATSLLLVSGHPQMMFLGLALAAAWTVGRALHHRVGREIWRVAAGLALGAALAGVQLLTTLALLGGAVSRTGASTSDPAYVLHRRLLPSTVLGDIFAKRIDFVAGTFEAMSYVGVAVAVLALVGVVDSLRRRRERADTLVVLATVAVATWLAQGSSSPLYRAASDVVPFFDQARVPARWLVVVPIALAVLAARGTSAIASRKVDRLTLVITGAAVLVVALAIRVGPFDLPAAKTIAAWVVAALLVAGGAALAVLGPRRLAALGVALVVVTVTVELGFMVEHGPLRASEAPASIADGKGAVVRYLQQHPGRILAMTLDNFADTNYLVEALRPNANTLFGIRSLDGYDGGPQVRKTWIQAVTALTSGTVNPELTLRADPAFPLDPVLYARYGVRYALVDTTYGPVDKLAPGWRGPIVTMGAVDLMENPRYAGDAFVYHRTERVTGSPGQALRRADTTTRESTALVPSDGPVLACATACDRDRASVHRVRPEDLVVRSASSSAGLLVISEQFDDGWHAQIDGRDAPVVKVDGFMLGVRVPAGRHTLELTYTAPGLHVGMAVSFVALLLVIALLVDRRARGSGRSGPQARAEAGTDADAGRSRSEPVVAAPGPATLGVHRRRPRLLNQRA